MRRCEAGEHGEVGIARAVVMNGLDRSVDRAIAQLMQKGDYQLAIHSVIEYGIVQTFDLHDHDVARGVDSVGQATQRVGARASEAATI